MGFPLLLQHGKEDQHIGAATQGQVWILFPCLSRRCPYDPFLVAARPLHSAANNLTHAMAIENKILSPFSFSSGTRMKTCR